MSRPGLLLRFQSWFAPTLTGPPALAFLPALALGAFWIGGEAALLVVSLGLPLVFAALGSFSRQHNARLSQRDGATGLMARAGFEAAIAECFEETANSGLRSACLHLEITDFADMQAHYGQEATDQAARQTGERIKSALRQGDAVARLDDSRFAVCLLPVRNLDLEDCIQLAGRIQTATEEPLSFDGLSVYLTCTIGFCLRGRAPGRTAQDWSDAAEQAMQDAINHGPSAIRAYSPGAKSVRGGMAELADSVAGALENGEIVPWFQPQISTDTGKVTGFETLARWNHPEHGVIGPSHFLPLMSEAGLIERLGRVMLYQALTALKAWDNAGVSVPSIGVNFAPEELRSPGLVDRIRWELDRFDLTPDRLAVEILETVVSDSPDDIVTRNIRALGELGCRIDLDDFGTGHASISAIRRFEISRIKIDRSFVMKADQDPEQQRMISAILTMAERLKLETLAEGVETVGEHALLAQLGCDHVQGFGIGRPMPFDQTLDWIAAHRSKLVDPPIVGRDIG